jgi:mannose-1-phosphate guanylyltransferase/mannose-6-phosphate isomerase
VLGAQRSPDTVLLVLAADHFVGDADAFCDACRKALPAAASGMIVTFGVVPATPATDYGYLKPGKPLNGSAVCELELFAEKPQQERAEQFLREGYLWNSGNFLFRSNTMREEIGRYEPAILVAAEGAVKDAVKDLDFLRLAEPAFSAAPKISIDFAVMERTNRSAVLPVTYEWSDLGSWDAVWAKAPRDSDGNALSGTCEVIDSHDVLVHADPSMVTSVIGLSDIVVVASPDAVMVAPRKVSGELKTLVERLKARNFAEAVAHRRVYRPWGYLETLSLGERYKVKKLQVGPGHRLSLQKHMHRSEHWVVVRGTGEITADGDVRILHENESVYMPIGAVHRLANPGRIPLELIEIQVGSYLGDDDIQRFEDDYNRA